MLCLGPDARENDEILLAALEGVDWKKINARKVMRCCSLHRKREEASLDREKEVYAPLESCA